MKKITLEDRVRRIEEHIGIGFGGLGSFDVAKCPRCGEIKLNKYQKGICCGCAYTEGLK